MIRLILAATLAATALNGCATLRLTPDSCQRALSGAQTAQEIIAFLQSRGVAPEIAAKVASALALGQITLATACAAANPPVAVPG